MRYHSHLLGPADSVCFSDAVLTGLAPDGGLYIPDSFPAPIEWNEDYVAFAAAFLAPFIAGDRHEFDIQDLCQQAFHFPLPLTAFSQQHYVMELYHGPSLSFKDFGAQFLAQVIGSIADQRQRLLMVATSGDTGSAVAAAFYQQAGINVAILYPADGVSARQAQQLSCWGDNIRTFAVSSDFDACQALVKSAFKQDIIREHYHLTTANSINIGRLLPQAVYYAYTSLWVQQQHDRPMNVIVPSGNLGNVTAAYWAKTMGYPIDRIVLSQNANRTVVAYCEDPHWQAGASLATLANAMDVGAPSNLARLQALYPDWEVFKSTVSAYAVSDAEIRQAIIDAHEAFGLVLCPHTATAYKVWQDHVDADTEAVWVLAATADAVKFNDIVEPLLGQTLAVPERFKQQLERPNYAVPLRAEMNALTEALCVPVG